MFTRTIIVQFRIVSDTSTNITFPSKPTGKLYFVVTAYDKGYNESAPSNEVGINVTSLENEHFASNFKLEQNYPNPFNPNTIIQFSITNRQKVSLKVYDVLGNFLSTLLDEEKVAGNYSVEFNSSFLPKTAQNSSGVLFYQLKVGTVIQTRKMILLK
jgi:hypothetical protein